MKFLPFLLVVVFCPALWGAETVCYYGVDQQKSMIEATGYKFTEKKGVTAKILGVKMMQKAGKSLENLFTDLSLEVDLMTLDSGNGIRDNNLRETFLSFVKDEAVAKVVVKKYKKESLLINLTLNGVQKPITFKTVAKKVKNGTRLVATGSIDALDFMMKPALAALGKRCGALHTGSDGKPKTWSDFGLKVTVVVKESCSEVQKNKGA